MFINYIYIYMCIHICIYSYVVKDDDDGEPPAKAMRPTVCEVRPPAIPPIPVSSSAGADRL